MFTLVKAKANSTASRRHVLARKAVWNVKTTNVNRSIPRGHGHIVEFANVCTISHRMRLTIDFSRFVVDLLANQHEASPTLC